jgi:hypothetical protein
VRTWIYLAALSAVALVSRLPQLLSRNLLLEGDECILGLMAIHLAQAREFPLFFYGQRYGLAIVEAPAAAVSFLLFGAGAVPLKIAILTVWIVGICFYFVAFARPLGAARSFAVSMLLVLMPAWAATSMKAWSGYVTAFSATGLALYLITRNDNRRATPWFATGAVSGLIFFSHPLWLPSLAPVVAFYLWTSRRLRFWLSYASGALLAVTAVYVIKVFAFAGAVETWTGPPAGNAHLLASVPLLLRQLYVNLTGSYYFGTVVPAGPATAAAAYLWFTVFGVGALLQIYRLFTRRYLLWSHLLFASVLSTLAANLILLEWRDARYVLAVDAPLAFLAGFELFDLADRLRAQTPRYAAALVLLLVLALEAAALTEFRRYTYMWWTNTASSPSEGRTLRRVVDHMRARGVTHAFAMNALLQWPITFYSNETVLARWKADVDRYPPYIRRIDRALERGDPIAIVGYTGYTYGLERMVRDPRSIVDIDGKYFVYIGADKDLLRRAGFRIPD